MSALRLTPIVISVVLLAAHWLRGGHLFLAVATLAMPFLLRIRRPWVPLLVQGLLVVGALEWVRTLMVLARGRALAGEPWTRMGVILGAVALFTLLSGLSLQGERVQRRYGAPE